MQAGRLRHRITINQKVVARNDFGEEIITWTEVGTFWGSVEPLQGRELLEARQAIADKASQQAAVLK